MTALIESICHNLRQANLLCIIYLFALYVDINMCNLAYIHISYCVDN